MTAHNMEIRHFHLFAGLGAGALGFQKAEARVGQLVARMRCLGGVDVSPSACRDFEALVGVPATCLDLFDREQYRDFHGKAPPPGWHEATPADLQRAAGGERPHIVFQSAPCKGFSGLLSQKASQSRKYQALNRLTVRGMWLMLEAFADDPPELIVFENVPRIQSRGRALLDRIQHLLESYGYATAETVHDCGELGGLGQHRRRFLLVARHREKVPPFLYEPPKRRVRSIGEILSTLPLPEHPAGGPMHTLPKLTWATWVRLALIPAGKDWRALQELAVVERHYQGLDGALHTAAILRDYALVPDTSWHKGILGVKGWGEAGSTVKCESHPTNGAYSVADPRSAAGWGGSGKYRVAAMEEPGGTVIAESATGNGAFAVADPRSPWMDGRAHHSILRVASWMQPGGTVTTSSRPASGGLAVADPRVRGLGDYQAYGVKGWQEAAGTVTGQAAPGGGAHSIADPRLNCDLNDTTGRRHNNVFRVSPWDEPSPTATGGGGPSSGGLAVADPRRLPAPNDRPDPARRILSLDDCWHRPLTTLELAALQGFPVLPEDADGDALVLDGTSHTQWRVGIGNAVPPPAAQAIASTMAQTLLLARSGTSFCLSAAPIWVDPALAIPLSIDLPEVM